MEAELNAEAPTSATKHADHEHDGHVVPLWLLAAVAGVLLVLTWLTVAVTAFNFGASANLVIAMAIALVKALLVALFFMHLWWDRPINGVVFISALLFVSIFIVLALLDKESYSPNIKAYWEAKDPAPKVENWEAAKASEEAAEEAATEAAAESAGEAPAGDAPTSESPAAEATE